MFIFHLTGYDQINIVEHDLTLYELLVMRVVP